jgi:hypothetical protein
MLTPKKTELICHVCKKPITGARTVINERWTCGPCTYKHDYPDREIVEVKRTRAKPYDGPSLFETTGYIKPKSRQQEHDDRA